MRVIKFRGKRIDTGEWVEGYGVCVVQEENIVNILHKQGYNLMQATAVHPETIGQFTGLNDKDGKEIWEGDIVEYMWANPLTKKVPVMFYSGAFQLGDWIEDSFDIFDSNRIEVIGNIHDNKELL